MNKPVNENNIYHLLRNEPVWANNNPIIVTQEDFRLPDNFTPDQQNTISFVSTLVVSNNILVPLKNQMIPLLAQYKVDIFVLGDAFIDKNIITFELCNAPSHITTLQATFTLIKDTTNTRLVITPLTNR